MFSSMNGKLNYQNKKKCQYSLLINAAVLLSSDLILALLQALCCKDCNSKHNNAAQCA